MRLTPEQEARMGEYVQKWIAIGLSTEPADRVTWERAARACYRYAGLAEPRQVVWVPSPLALVFAAPTAGLILAMRHDRDLEAAVRSAVDPVIGSAIGSAVRSAVDSAVDAAVGAAVYATVRSAVRSVVDLAIGDSEVDSAVHSTIYLAISAVRSAIRSVVDPAMGAAIGPAIGAPVYAAVDAAVSSAVYSAVDAAVGSAVRAAIGAAIGAAVYAAVDAGVSSAVRSAVGSVDRAVRSAVDAGWLRIFGGQFWTGGLYWYGTATLDYLREVVKPERVDDEIWGRHQAWADTVRSAGWWWPHHEFVMVSDRPMRLHRDDTGQLHCGDGPAIQWPDGWGIYALHGVRVPPALVLTPAECLDPAILLREGNLEIRREIVRKIGVERVCARLRASVIDQQGEYELLVLDLRDGRRRPYLKMRNPSIGVYHIEGVHPECTTVAEAINWRASGDRQKPWEPEVLT